MLIGGACNVLPPQWCHFYHPPAHILAQVCLRLHIAFGVPCFENGPRDAHVTNPHAFHGTTHNTYWATLLTRGAQQAASRHTFIYR
jgi:hypothetical protein